MPRSARHGRAAARLLPLGEGRLRNRRRGNRRGRHPANRGHEVRNRRPVSAENNSQMRLYALGALEMFGDLYDIDTVSMTIYQPRLSNISTDTISRADLLEWAETVLRPVAELAYKGEGELNAGSWCRFCKLRSTCRKARGSQSRAGAARFQTAAHALGRGNLRHPGQAGRFNQLGRGHPGIRAERGAVRHPL